jgi:excisionase family DNA binding protein
MLKPANEGRRAYPLHEAARQLGISYRTLSRRIRNGEITAVSVSERRKVVTARELDRVLGLLPEAA